MHGWHMGGGACWQRTADAEPGWPTVRRSRKACWPVGAECLSLQGQPACSSLLEMSKRRMRLHAGTACCHEAPPPGSLTAEGLCAQALHGSVPVGRSEYAIDTLRNWRTGKACQAPSKHATKVGSDVRAPVKRKSRGVDRGLRWQALAPAALHPLSCHMLEDVLCLSTALILRLAKTLIWLNLAWGRPAVNAATACHHAFTEVESVTGICNRMYDYVPECHLRVCFEGSALTELPSWRPCMAGSGQKG